MVISPFVVTPVMCFGEVVVQFLSEWSNELSVDTLVCLGITLPVGIFFGVFIAVVFLSARCLGSWLWPRECGS